MVGNPTGSVGEPGAGRTGGVRAMAVAKAASRAGKGGFGPEPGNTGPTLQKGVQRQTEAEKLAATRATNRRIGERRESIQDIKERIGQRRENIQDIKKGEPTSPVTTR